MTKKENVGKATKGPKEAKVVKEKPNVLELKGEGTAMGTTTPSAKLEVKKGPLVTAGTIVSYYPGFADRDVAKKTRKAVPALVTEVNGEDVCLTVFPPRVLPVVKEDVPYSEVGLVDVHYWNFNLD